MIANRAIDSVLILCADIVSELVFADFSALNALSDMPASPFDIKRKGLILYMKYSANKRSISSFVKIVNFVRQDRAKGQICLMAVYMKELKINTPLSYFVVGKFWAKSRSASWPLVKNFKSIDYVVVGEGEQTLAELQL